MKGFLYLIFLLFAITTNAHETIKIMFYNLLEFPEASPVNREVLLRDLLAEYDPDIFMSCESLSEEGTDLNLDITPTNLITIHNTLVQNFINITISEEYTGYVSFSIYNTLGQKVFQYESENKKNNTIEVLFLDAGLFYIKASITNSNPHKFLKTN